ncbi:MAG TPA: tetratricopeptide repeat protein [Thermoanaerobaculia bacterium]
MKKRRRRIRGSVLEHGRRLSDSLLWKLQRRYFEREGAAAWTQGFVPQYITSNPWIANAYAKVVLGWLRDGSGTGAGESSFPPLDLRHPVHIVELGCGSGRFGYLFLTRLLDLLGRSSLHQVPVRYVMTDFTQSNLDPLRDHPSLRPFVEEGLLDFARYDAGQDSEILLSRSGEALTAGTLRNPLVVIANYVFDGIPQDAFRIRDGKVFELLPVLSVESEEPDLEDPGLLNRIEVAWEEREASTEYYGFRELDDILADYAAHFEGRTLLFPRAAIRCARNLVHLSGGRLLLLSGDKGFSREELLGEKGEPGIANHGSFSMMVNYHALGRWFAGQGGEMLETSRFHSSLTIVACLLGTPPGGLVETRLAFDDAIERMGPDDFFDLKKGLDDSYDTLTLEQVLAWLRFSGWDSNVFLACFPRLMQLAEHASDVLRIETYRMAHEVWRNHFPLPEARDLAFHLGVVLCEIQCYVEAMAFFEESIASYGRNPATVFNLALCHFHLDDLEAARTHLDEALQGAPDFEPALALKGEIEAALSER